MSRVEEGFKLEDLTKEIAESDRFTADNPPTPPASTAVLKPVDPRDVKLDLVPVATASAPATEDAENNTDSSFGAERRKVPFDDAPPDWPDKLSVTALGSTRSWGDVELATVYTYELKNFDGSGGLREVTRQQHRVRMKTTPFGCGSFRVCYYLCDLSNRKRLVAKQPLAVDPLKHTIEAALCEVETHLVATHIANAFNATNPPKRVVFGAVAIYQFPERNTAHRTFVVEPVLVGAYKHFTDNERGVAPDCPNTLLAFRHFSWDFSCKRYIVTDLQGVAGTSTFALSDPVIHNKEKEPVFSVGNGRELGIDATLKTHRCSSLCVGLSSLPIASDPVTVSSTGTQRGDQLSPQTLCQNCGTFYPEGLVCSECHVLPVPSTPLSPAAASATPPSNKSTGQSSTLATGKHLAPISLGAHFDASGRSVGNTPIATATSPPKGLTPSSLSISAPSFSIRSPQKPPPSSGSCCVLL